MIMFPSEFVKTKYNGYFWNTLTKELYSIKIRGVLKKMTIQKEFIGYVYGRYVDCAEGYAISVNGIQKRLPLKYLMTLNIPMHDEFIDAE